MTNLIFISDILLVSIAFIWLIAASLTDIKKREVPNWLSFSLIAIAFAIRSVAALISAGTLTNSLVVIALFLLALSFMYFIIKEFKLVFQFIFAIILIIIGYFLINNLEINYLSFSILFLGIFFILANLFYYTRIFGGGDAKLLMALSVVFATTPAFAKNIIQSSIINLNEPFLIIFLINIFALGALYGLVFSIFSSIKNRKTFKKEFKKIIKIKQIRSFILFFWILSFLCLVFSFFSLTKTIEFFSYNWFLISFIIFLIFPFLYIFIKTAENLAMIRKVAPNKLTEGDWLLKSVKIKNKVIKPSVHGLTKKDIKLLKKRKKLVLIKYGLPFVPIFLFALIISLFVGDLLLLIIHLLFGI